MPELISTPELSYELYKFHHFLEKLEEYIPGFTVIMTVDEIRNLLVITMIRKSDGAEAVVELDRTQQYYSDELMEDCLREIEKLQEETNNERED